MSAEQRLIAYLDGELSPAEREAFEAELAADPALAAQVELHAALSARVARTYAPILDEPVPPRLIAIASVANDRGGLMSSLPRWAAMAACLVVGVLGGRAFWPQGGPLAMHGQALVAQGSLDHALTGQLASDPGAIRVGLSFRARDGRYCRTFQSPGDHLAGLACRGDGRWVAETAVAWTAQAQPDYRTAASATPPAVLAAVDAMIAGEALDAAGERAARDRGWKP
jgi:anti-sigma factor RsiW